MKIFVNLAEEEFNKLKENNVKFNYTSPDDFDEIRMSSEIWYYADKNIFLKLIKKDSEEEFLEKYRKEEDEKLNELFKEYPLNELELLDAIIDYGKEAAYELISNNIEMFTDYDAIKNKNVIIKSGTIIDLSNKCKDIESNINNKISNMIFSENNITICKDNDKFQVILTTDKKNYIIHDYFSELSAKNFTEEVTLIDEHDYDQFIKSDSEIIDNIDDEKKLKKIIATYIIAENNFEIGYY